MVVSEALVGEKQSALCCWNLQRREDCLSGRDWRVLCEAVQVTIVCEMNRNPVVFVRNDKPDTWNFRFYTVHVVELLNYYTNHCTYIKFIKFTH